MKTLQPNYAFSPSLLDAFQRMVDTKVEDYFYQDETGAWHLNWSEADESFHYSEEEVDARLKQEFIDYVNKVPTPPSEAASKGTAFNEIVDCLIKRCKPTGDVSIFTIRSADDLYKAKVQSFIKSEAKGEDVVCDFDREECRAEFDKIGTPFIFASVDGFCFYFDKDFCIEAAEYFKNSICQYYTECLFETSKGVVELHGYIDYLREDKVFDCKTTKSYTFGNYQKRWQRYTYPFALIESGMMNEVSSFEFTVFVLSGGSSRTPLITGKQYKEVYTYNHEQARTMLKQQCERVIEFLEENKNLIMNKKVYGISDNRQD